MKDVNVRVSPAASGWSINCDLPLETTYYRSGARAEHIARRIANNLCGAGLTVEVSVYGLDGFVVGTHRYAGWTRPPEAMAG
ncbi:MAG: hypothetical protein GC203_20330 [Phenylobacterium sp.]|uniref:hypothetical protein n=1 Tax=Phenylobacterium sp. TaxID=1871053 RepID=UPI0025CC07C6|nr:hypothetical protein [Phenylobacterium sp.]MBI1200212.1 hypothetical protein [Phenylobacterium sp.]